MAPNYLPEDIVFCRRSKKIKINDVVVMDVKSHGRILKRICSITDEGVYVNGDNKSYPSPIYEALHQKISIIGIVVFKLPSIFTFS
ncbi:MAG: phage repressor protein C with HTH and peptisase S24 domain [Woeseiaceae bacterium]|jgi:phage repressor protein C with HTH and peptisase S24 domain|tara:strand:+ start:877 stop:1134 length:258 start_codon:yes stop_codon:yes gene_type:complete